MFRQLRKTLVATLIAPVTVGQVLPAFADSSDTLPDMGTTAGSTLSIGQRCKWATTMSASCAAAPR